MQIVDAGPLIEDGAIEALEKQLGTTLPSDYRVFLLEYNGGCPEPCDFRVPTHPEGAFGVHVLFGILNPTDSSDLAWNLRYLPSRVGENLLPIGRTDTGDRVLLVTAGPHRGHILFWDSMASDLDNALYEVSSSFREFLDSLSDID